MLFGRGVRVTMNYQLPIRRICTRTDRKNKLGTFFQAHSLFDGTTFFFLTTVYMRGDATCCKVEGAGVSAHPQVNKIRPQKRQAQYEKK